MSECPDERASEIREILAGEAAQPDLFTRDVDVKDLAAQVAAEEAAGSGQQEVHLHPDLQAQFNEELAKQRAAETVRGSSTVSKVSGRAFRAGYDAIFPPKN